MYSLLYINKFGNRYITFYFIDLFGKLIYYLPVSLLKLKSYGNRHKYITLIEIIKKIVFY